MCLPSQGVSHESSYHLSCAHHWIAAVNRIVRKGNEGHPVQDQKRQPGGIQP